MDPYRFDAMLSLLFYVLDILVIAVVGLLVINVKFKSPKHTLLPPSPPAEPLIGHARLIPREGQADFYHEMRKCYGTFRSVIYNAKNH
jgi:hypothetical protein